MRRSVKRYLCLALLGLSLQAPAQPPGGWFVAGSAPRDYDYGVDPGVAVEGRSSAYVRARVSQPGGFGTLMQTIAPDEYRGKRVQLSAQLRTAQAQRAQLWMRVDGPDRKVLAFDNMDDRPIVGTTEWARHEIVLDVPAEATAIAFGFFLNGRGQVWADALLLGEVDRSVPATGGPAGLPRRPINPGFEE